MIESANTGEVSLDVKNTGVSREDNEVLEKTNDNEASETSQSDAEKIQTDDQAKIENKKSNSPERKVSSLY